MSIESVVVWIWQMSLIVSFDEYDRLPIHPEKFQVGEIANMSDNLEPRIRNVEEAMQILTQLALRADERMDTLDRRADGFDRKMEELAEDFDRKIGELAEGFDRKIGRLAEGFDKKIGELAEMQKQTEANLSALTSIVADLGRAQTRTEKALASLSEKLDRYIGGKL